MFQVIRVFDDHDQRPQERKVTLPGEENTEILTVEGLGSSFVRDQDRPVGYPFFGPVEIIDVQAGSGEDDIRLPTQISDQLIASFTVTLCAPCLLSTTKP